MTRRSANWFLRAYNFRRRTPARREPTLQRPEPHNAPGTASRSRAWRSRRRRAGPARDPGRLWAERRNRHGRGETGSARVRHTRTQGRPGTFAWHVRGGSAAEGRPDLRRRPGMPRRLVLINARAGTILDGLGGDPKEAMRRAFAAAELEADIRFVRPHRLPDLLDRAARSDYDQIIVGGGDGTFSCAVGHLAGTDKVLGLLPLGTMNLFGRDIGAKQPFAAGVTSLAKAEPRRIDLGEINGRLFHSLVGVGFFAQMARAREEMRGFALGRWIGLGLAAFRAFIRTGALHLGIEADGRMHDVDAFAVLVTNNHFEAPSWRRARLDSGRLEIHIAHNAPTLTRAKAGLDVLLGTWRQNETLEAISAETALIASRRRRLWISVDGEVVRARLPLRLAICPRALRVLVPQSPRHEAGERVDA